MTQRDARQRLRINARLVRERDRARARELRRVLFYGAPIVGPLLAYVWQRVDFIRLSYRVEALKAERQRLLEEHKVLIVERSHLLAPDRIEHLARRQLGLVDPAPEDVRQVVLADGRVSLVGPRASAGARPPLPGDPAPDVSRASMLGRAALAAITGVRPAAAREKP